MVISVTSEEFSRRRTTLVNGLPIHTEDITRVYIIEPLGHVDARKRGHAWVLIGVGLIWSAYLYLLL
jgi:hypothetical protein